MRQVRGQFIARLTLRAVLRHCAGTKTEGSLTVELRYNAIFCVRDIDLLMYIMDKSMNFKSNERVTCRTKHIYIFNKKFSNIAVIEYVIVSTTIIFLYYLFKNYDNMTANLERRVASCKNTRKEVFCI